jgi:hypothetical protein
MLSGYGSFSSVEKYFDATPFVYHLKLVVAKHSVKRQEQFRSFLNNNPEKMYK